MGEKTFRPWDVDQQLLFPPSVKDFVPSGHLSQLIRDVVREELDTPRSTPTAGCFGVSLLTIRR